MAKLLRSALSEDENEKESQLTDGSDSLVDDDGDDSFGYGDKGASEIGEKHAADEELPIDGNPEHGDELDMSEGPADEGLTLGGPGDQLSLVQGDADGLEGLDEILHDAYYEPAGVGLRAHEQTDPQETPDEVRDAQYGKQGIDEMLRGMGTPKAQKSAKKQSTKSKY